ncbi:MAG: hypothetical protein IPK82_17465 [Polyangiaceae bacterium]|nr:hypothetical protein [Polyangiaceae bacterium]
MPLELAYTFPAPELGATLCEEGFKAIGSLSKSNAVGKVVCPAGCESGDGEKICILGFLGLTSVIERQTASLRSLAGTSADFGFRIGARPGESLDIFRKAQFAAVTRANAVSANATEPVLDTLRAVSRTNVGVFDSWAGWKEGVASHPSLLVLIVHKDKENDRHIIEIGNGQFAAVTQIKESYVDPDKSTHPVVLLVGCSTGVSETEFQNLPIQFQDSGAALVVGTVATVLGRDAGPVTAELIRTMAELSNLPNMAMGDALLRTKQKMVSQGKLMALCLSSYGDSGWLITAPAKSSQQSLSVTVTHAQD